MSVWNNSKSTRENTFGAKKAFNNFITFTAVPFKSKEKLTTITQT